MKYKNIEKYKRTPDNLINSKLTRFGFVSLVINDGKPELAIGEPYFSAACYYSMFRSPSRYLAISDKHSLSGYQYANDLSVTGNGTEILTAKSTLHDLSKELGLDIKETILLLKDYFEFVQTERIRLIDMYFSEKATVMTTTWQFSEDLSAFEGTAWGMIQRMPLEFPYIFALGIKIFNLGLNLDYISCMYIAVMLEIDVNEYAPMNTNHTLQYCVRKDGRGSYSVINKEGFMSIIDHYHAREGEKRALPHNKLRSIAKKTNEKYVKRDQIYLEAGSISSVNSAFSDFGKHNSSFKSNTRLIKKIKEELNY